MLRRPVEFTQDLSLRSTERLAAACIAPSNGSTGESYDNALGESVIGLYETEVIHRSGPWRSVDEVEYATLEWVAWFNQQRLPEPLGDLPPAEYEEQYYRTPAVAAVVEALNCVSLRHTRGDSKRALDGRASFPLLRRRVLAA